MNFAAQNGEPGANHKRDVIAVSPGAGPSCPDRGTAAIYRDVFRLCLDDLLAPRGSERLDEDTIDRFVTAAGDYGTALKRLHGYSKPRRK